ncbi:transposase [Streptomyces sp. ACA25]|uniref:IS701 family transposase n=1 Tax=Streptomyces sp. ACA25 TaxID=3022596 RepID=UPI002307C6CE|nr:transposase [Streptomyces sp. ACA25]MDB1086966.1 transposase [Streptomyces sp. ACA25]
MTGPGAATGGGSLVADGSTTLAAFSDTIFSDIRRADQRRWAQAYLSGLLITPGNKSVRRLAGHVSTSRTAAQSLRQFVSSSPWDCDPVMRKLTRWVEACKPASAWTLHRVVTPKSGDRSVGVHRYFDPSANRTLNCQLSIGAFLSIGPVQVPVDWRLHLPAPWTKDAQLRRRARIPDTVQHRPLSRQMLDLVDALASRAAHGSVPVVTDVSDTSACETLVRGLSRRGHDFVVALHPRLWVCPTGEGAPHSRGLVGAGECLAAGAVDTALVTTESGRQWHTQVRSALVHLPGARGTAAPDGPFRLLTEVTQDDRPGPVWITNLTHRPFDDIMSLTTRQASAAAAVDALKRDFGLGDFEGRSFPGWYHHATLVSSAYAYQHLAATA